MPSILQSKHTMPAQKPHARASLPAQSKTKLGSANAVPRTSEILRRRGTGLWAVGVAVIAGAGAVLGAQLKERQQTQQRLAEIRGVDANGESIPTAVSDTARVTASTTTSHVEAAKSDTELRPNMRTSTTTNANVDILEGGRVTSYQQRQISHLEDRRGVLTRQKLDLEQKIERVREKMRNEEQMESRRSAGIGAER